MDKSVMKYSGGGPGSIIRGRKKRALSLAELIIGLCLFAIAIIPIFGIIPTAYFSIKKAEDYSSASCYAHEVIDNYRITNPSISDDVHREWPVCLNNTEYNVSVDLIPQDVGSPSNLIDVVVTLKWKKIPEQYTLYSRIFYSQ